MQEKLLSKVVAVILILILTLADILFLGLKVVSYATNELSNQTITNNENVTFDVYFKGENEEISAEEDVNIDSTDMKLFMQIAVKKEGYFNGTISLINSNFKLKQEILSEKINKRTKNNISF